MVGSAEKENARFIDSIEGKITKLKEQFNSLVTTTISTDSVKTFLDVLTSVLETVNNIVKAFDNIGMSAPLMIGVFASLGKTIKALGTGSALTVTGGGIFSNLLGRAGVQLPQILQQSTTATEGFRVALTNTSEASVLASTKTALLTAGVTLLNTVMTGLAIGAIALVCKGLYDYVNANQIAHDKIEENIDTTKSNINSYTQQKNSLKDIAEEYDNLADKTNKSTKESERYHELQQQIADTAPDLVLGQDSSGNPILALNGSLEDYIDNLDSAIKREQEFLKIQQNALANTSIGNLVKFNKDKSIVESSLGNMSNFSDAWDDSGSWWNKKELKNAKDGANAYIRIVQERNDKVNKLNKILTEHFTEVSQIEAEQQQKVFNELGDDYLYKNYNKLAKDGIKNTKNIMDTLIGNFNWGSEVVDTVAKQKNFIESFDTIASKVGKSKEEMQEWNKTLSEANYAFQETGDYEQFQKDISGITEELEKMTGIDAEDWAIGLTPALQGSLDADSIALNNFLKNYNKTLTELKSGDKVAIRIQAEYEDTNDFIQKITNMENRQQQIDYMVKINTGEVEYGNLPYQIQEMIKGTLDGGKTMQDWESDVVMKIATEIQSNGELDDKTFGLITKMLNGELTDAEIKAGITLPSGDVLNAQIVGEINEVNKNKDKNIKVGIEADSEKLDEDLSTILGDKEEAKQLKVDLVTNFNENKFETFNELIKDMDSDKQIQIATAFINNGDADPDEIEQFISSLPDEIQKIVRIKYEESGKNDVENSVFNESKVQTIILDANDEKAKNKIENLGKTLDDIDGVDRNIKLGIIENAGKSNATTQDMLKALDLVKDLPEEKRLDVISNLQDIMSDMDNLDKQQIKDKLVEILGDNSDAEAKTKQTKNNNIPNKNFDINANDKASNKINSVKNNNIPNKPFDIIVNVVENVVGAFKWLMGQGGKGTSSNYTVPKQNSISDFLDVGSDPVAIDNSTPTAQSMDFNSMSDNPSIVDSDSTINNTSSAISKVKAFTTQALRGFTDIGKSTTISTKIDIKKSTLDSIEYSVNLMQELEYRIDNVNDKLSLLDVKMENAVGTKKIEYLQKQNALYEEQAKLQKELYDNLTQEKGIVKNKLKNYGFKFDKQGNLTQYEEVLLKMEKRSKELEEQAEKASKKASDYDTKSSSVDSDKYDTSSKKTKKSLQKKADNVKDTSDEYKEKLEKVKDLTEQYLKMQRDEIPDAEKEWLEMQNAIKENNDEIEKLELEDKLYKFKNSVTGLANQYDIWGDKIDLIDTKLNNSLQTDKVSLYQQKLSALNKQLEIQEKTLTSLKNQLPVYQEALAKYGVQFGKNGNIINMSNVLNKYQNSEDLEKINDLMEEYNDLIRDTIPNAQQEYEDLNNAIQDVYDSQLDVVKDIEDKITDVIKDQIDKRKDLIQKQYDKEIELLNKRKDEYNKNKDTDDYYKDLEEAQEEIDKIQTKINRASLDDSLSGRSTLSDLMDDLKEAQDKYNDVVSNRTDDLINDMYDDEIDRLQKESDDKIQELEDKWSDSKIAEIVTQALGSGVFTDIDGNVHDLQDTLISFAEESGDALGVLGDKIKTELSLNLQEALSYIQQYSDIFNGMGLEKLGNINYSDKLNNKSLKVDDIRINVYGTEGMNEEDLAKEVKKQIENKFSEITNGGLL